MEEEENKDQNAIMERLKKIRHETFLSSKYYHDSTESIKELIQIIKEILTKNTIEEYFSNEEETFKYFNETFIKEVITFLISQTNIDGEDGDELTIELFCNIFKLFLKFHNNEKYNPLFESIRKIFDKGRFFISHKYTSQDIYKNEIKHDFNLFNSEFCSEFQKSINKYNIGDEIDFPYESTSSRFDFLNKVWMRGRITDIKNDNYYIQFCDKKHRENFYTIPVNNCNIYPKGTKTKDWDWRINLKKYDIIDCFDRNKWYPATVVAVDEKEVNGYKNVKYNIAFRLYIDHFKNPDNENDTYDKHIDIWKLNGRDDIKEEDDDKYVGDTSNINEDIIFYSKRIQKFGTFSALQQKFIDSDFSSSNKEHNEYTKTIEKLIYDTNIDIDENYFFEKNGKKNYILGKSENNFYYFFAKLLKLIEKDGGFEKIIEILLDNPSTETIINSFLFLVKSFPYLHKEYFIRNKDIIKNSCINYINNLDDKKIRKIPKELNELIINLVYEINKYTPKKLKKIKAEKKAIKEQADTELKKEEKFEGKDIKEDKTEEIKSEDKNEEENNIEEKDKAEEKKEEINKGEEKEKIPEKIEEKNNKIEIEENKEQKKDEKEKDETDHENKLGDGQEKNKDKDKEKENILGKEEENNIKEINNIQDNDEIKNEEQNIENEKNIVKEKEKEKEETEINEENEDNEEKDEEEMDFYDEITLTFAIKSIKTSIFDYRLKGIKDLNDIIEKNRNNKKILSKILSLIKQSNIINEIFGANYHSQLIKHSNEILILLLKENELDENDITLIWSCTKRGDLEVKLIIFKLLSDIAGNLKENYIEILLNNVISNVDKKINNEEIELVYKLSTQNDNNEKNIMYCCEYLCKCLLMGNSQDIEINKILEKITLITEKNDKYLKKVLEICENSIENNDKTIPSFSILEEILKKNIIQKEEKNEEKEVIKEFIKDNHLISLFEKNLKLYLQKAKEIFEKNKIPFTDGELISKYIIDEYTHFDNIKKRLDILPFLIDKYYPEYDFLPFLKEVLISNPVGVDDQLIFYDFIKKYISDKTYTSKTSLERKEKLRKDLFELISNNDKGEITLEQLKLFITIFFDINKEKIKLNDDIDYKSTEKEGEYNIKNISNIDELIGLDKLWNIIFQINEEKSLNLAINVLYQIYKNENIEKLILKCNDYILKENKEQEQEKNKFNIIEKYITLMRLIIIESEKNIIFMPRAHLNLLKNCFINLPLEIKGKEVKVKDNLEKIIIFGNTNFNNLKIYLSEIYEISPDIISFSLSKNFLKFLQKNNLNKKDNPIIDESYNNISLYDLIIKNDNTQKIKSDLLPKDKITFSTKKIEEEKFLINGEMNPKLKIIFKDWFKQFTKGTMKMDDEAIIRFIEGVTPNKNITKANDKRVTEFMKNDKEKRGYVNEEEFLLFFDKAIKDPFKISNVRTNLEYMGIGKDLRKKQNEFNENDICFCENDKLPRYKLGNNFDFMNKLFEIYYNEPEKNYKLINFLNYLSTNEQIYNDVLENLFNEENKDNYINRVFEDKNKYLEHDYIFIIIESILQDCEYYFYNKYYIDNNDFLLLENSSYKLIVSNNEPFFDSDLYPKKINFGKKLLKAENLQKIINNVNSLLERLLLLINESKNINNISIIYDFCLRGIKLINILNNFCSINNTMDNSKQNMKQTGVYFFGLFNISQIYEEDNLINEFDNLIYKDLTNNLLNILCNINSFESEIKEKELNLKQESFDLLIRILSCNKNILNNYEDENNSQKNEIIKLITDKFVESESSNKELFINNIITSVKNAENNNNKKYTDFLFNIVNNLLNNLINPDNNKINFTPDNSFFDLYSILHKSKPADNDNSNNTNESAMKIYELIMQKINNSDINNKIFLSLLKFLSLQITNNDPLKSEILFNNQQSKDKTLFDFLLEHAIPEITDKSNKKEANKKNEEEIISLNKPKAIEESKFILLENIKEDKKDENDDDNFEEELSTISNDFLLNCFDNTSDPKLISQLLNIIYLIKKYEENNSLKDIDDNTDSDDNNNAFQYQGQSLTQVFTSKKCGHVGLKNLGCICYMNSILQQMYMVPTFRYAIMSADDHKNPDSQMSNFFDSVDDNLLHQLQIMYTYLTFSNKSDYSPKDFCYSYKDFDGKPTNVRAQQDSQEFYNNFCDKIENSLKITKFKYIVSDVFAGQTCSSVECSNCKNLSNRFEDFYNLTLEVKNISDLNDSLQKMNVPEIIDDFKCSNCNQKVRISKIASLNKLPNVLVVHLKRFYLNYETFKTKKINSKFEFPKKLNLKQFCVSEIQKNSKKDENQIYTHEEDYYEYELKGINVHTGSADGGHYFSFIDVNRDGKNNLINNYPKENWLQFNDSKVSEFDIDSIPKECYGGNYEGSSYENIQNAYLLIYERKKKVPIRVLFEESEIEKIKKENNDKNIVTINKDNRNEIYKEYDLSRINNNNINEKDLYEKIFYDEERNEYYKYVSFYGIKKYAPRKVYNEIMKENNTKQETPNKINTNKFKTNKKKYESILSCLFGDLSFDINNELYNDNMKQVAIASILNDLIKEIKSTDDKDNEINEEGIIQFNKVLEFIFSQLIKPCINEESSVELLKSFNKYFCKDIFIKMIFSSNYRDNSAFHKIISESNAKMGKDIIFELIKIFIEYREKDENKNLYRTLLKVIGQSNIYRQNNFDEDNYNLSDDESKKENNNKYQFTIYLIYELVYDIIQLNSEVLEYFIEKKIISTLAKKINAENEKIRKIIYEMLKYIIKKTNDYNHELFELEEIEEEKPNINCPLDEIKGIFEEEKMIIQVLLINEDFELYKILLILSSFNDIEFTRDYYFLSLTRLYEYYIEEKKENKINIFLEIMFSLATINDDITLRRLEYILGYPSPIIKQIPKDDQNDQKWPIFGVKLINGNIDTHIYEYININHNNNNLCLLRLLLPNENDDDKTRIISDEQAKKYILKIWNNCLGDKNNYPLFKYLYLNPGRSLRYENLYEEIKNIISKEKDCKFENYEEKEKKFINNVDKEVEKCINDMKDEDTEVVDEDDCEPPPVMQNYFKCSDEAMKKFLGYNCDIIPGEIIREEISQIANGDYLAMYRLEYYTKYYSTKELREKLIQEEKNKKENIKAEVIKNDENENEKEKDNIDTTEENINNIEIKEKEKEEEQVEKKDKSQENEEIKEKEEDNKDNSKEEKKENTEDINNKEEKEAQSGNKDDNGDKNNKEEDKKEVKDPKEENEEKEENKEKEVKDPKEENKEKEEEEDNKEEKKEEKQNKEEKEDNKEENKEEKEIKEKNKELKEESSSEKDQNEIPIETEIDDSFELREKANRKTVLKFDIEDFTENDFIYKVLNKKKSSIILEDKSIKDKNKVKRTLFRYIFTNISHNKKKYRAKISTTSDLRFIQRMNCGLLHRFIFDSVKEENITNFNNIMRIRGELPFMERENLVVSIDIQNRISFEIK